MTLTQACLRGRREEPVVDAGLGRGLPSKLASIPSWRATLVPISPWLHSNTWNIKDVGRDAWEYFTVPSVDLMMSAKIILMLKLETMFLKKLIRVLHHNSLSRPFQRHNRKAATMQMFFYNWHITGLTKPMNRNTAQARVCFCMGRNVRLLYCHLQLP